MREVTIHIWDDIDWAQEGKRNAAVTTVTVGLDGKWVQLELTDANSARVRELLAPLMKAGTAQEEQAVAVSRRRGRPAGYMIPRESLDRGKALRKFAAEHGIPYVTSTGKYYYSTKLRQAFESYEAEQEKHHGDADRAVPEDRAGAAGGAGGGPGHGARLRAAAG